MSRGGESCAHSIITSFIIQHNSSVSLHLSAVIIIIKNCLASCSGRNSLCYIPLAMTEHFEEVYFPVKKRSNKQI